MSLKKSDKAHKQADPKEKLKYEIASDLGLSEKIDMVGMSGLTARETGKLGGLMSSSLRKKSNPEE